MNINTIAVIGLGYIGLPTAAVLAAREKKVIGVDINPQTVEIINQGKIHIKEPELDMLVHATVTEGFLHATTKPKPADVFIIAVPTPSALAANMAFQIEGKIDPPLGSCWANPKRRSGYFSK